MNTNPPGNTQESVSEPVTKPLKSRVLGGGLWLLTGNGVERGLRFVRMAVLARLLAPDDFGLMGLITMVLAYLDAITFTATNQAIIQHPSGRTKEFLNTAFTIGIVRGLVLAVLVFASAPFVAAFFGEPKLTSMIRFTAIVPAVTGLMNPGVQLVLKDLNFRRWAIYQLISRALSVTITILLGLWLRSAWALVIGLLGEQIILASLSYVVGSHRPGLAWDSQSARHFFKFCRQAFAIPLLIGFLLQAPNILLGKLTDMTTLGTFVLTLALADVPTYILTRIVATIGLPAYSSISADLDRLRTAWLRAITNVVALALIAGLIVVLSAKHLLTLAYGPAYAAQAPVLRVLCIYVVMRMLFTTTGPLMWAVGRPKVNRSAYLVGLAVTYLTGVFLVQSYGSAGMAVALGAGWTSAAAVEILLCLRYFALARQELGLPDARTEATVG